MDKNFTIMEARKMSKNKLQVEIGKCCKKIEELGMTHKTACEFVSGIMNLGIAAQELQKEQKKLVTIK